MKVHFFIGLALLTVSAILMSQGIEPFATHFYSFAWWSYILVIDSIIYRLMQNSYIINRRREFFLLIPWSIAFWLIFELYNFKINNWHYIDLPDATWVRWTGYTIAYATVLPGLFETHEFLRALGLYQSLERLKGRIFLKPRTHFCLLLGGVFCLVAPILSPTYFFPTVWLGFIFLLEPLNYRWGGISLMRDWEEGNFREVLLLLTSGFICGFFWEFWNFWAGAKWVYTVPFFHYLKVFEMPLLGFLGFPPFAVECYVMYNFISLLLGIGPNRRGLLSREATLKPLPKALLLLTSILSFLIMFNFIDLYSVKP
jgi:hypothetical protein